MHHYNAFGVNIASEFSIPELNSCDGNPDVIIKIGYVPEELTDPCNQGVLYQINHDQFLLKIKNIAKYLVSNGTKIFVEPDPHAKENDIRLFLLTSPLGALLHQRSLFPIHASAISTNNGCAVFAGPSGIGKSTLASAFCKRNYSVLSDDLCVATPIDQCMMILPGIPHLKIWHDVLEKHGYEPSRFQIIRDNMKRYYYPLNGQFSQIPQPLSSIYILESTNQNTFQLNEIKGATKLEFLIKNTYRYHFLKNHPYTSNHFKQMAEIANQAKVVQVKRPRHPFLLDELVELLEKDFDS